MKTALLVAASFVSLASSTFASTNPIVPVAQGRSVSGSANADNQNIFFSDSDSDTATDFGPFLAAVSGTVNPGDAYASGGGIQDSQISASSIQATGSAFANAESYDFEWFADAGGSSSLTVTFQVAVESSFSLVGSIAAFDNGISSAELRDANQNFIAGAFATGPAQELDLNSSGTLSPGEYTLSCFASGSTLASGGEFDYAFGEYDVALDVTPVGPGSAFCFGTIADCPCGNASNTGGGCDNAQGTGGVRLAAKDFQPDVNGNGTVVLTGYGYPTGATPTAIVIRSTALEPTPVVFGDGIRCIGLTNLVRMGATTAQNGVSTHPLLHQVGHGTYEYQAWYRNTPATFCDAAAAFNLSSGYELIW